jgi:hypothetical protein
MNRRTSLRSHDRGGPAAGEVLGADTGVDTTGGSVVDRSWPCGAGSGSNQPYDPHS